MLMNHPNNSRDSRQLHYGANKKALNGATTAANARLQFYFLKLKDI